MGLDDRPTYECYWATYSIHPSGPVSWHGIDSNYLWSFFILLTILLMTPHKTTNWKIRPIVDRLQTAFPHFYVPEKDVSIDETMVAFTGRLQFKQYIPIKPQKYGIKVRYTIHLNFWHKMTQTCSVVSTWIVAVLPSPLFVEKSLVTFCYDKFCSGDVVVSVWEYFNLAICIISCLWQAGCLVISSHLVIAILPEHLLLLWKFVLSTWRIWNVVKHAS